MSNCLHLILANQVFSTLPMVLLNILSNTFGKGYLAPIDYLALLVIVVFSSVISIGLYYGLLNPWIRALKHPFNLRLIFIGLAIILVATLGYIFLLKVYLLQVPPKRILWPSVVMAVIWIIYTIVLTLWGKQIRKA